MTRIWLLMVVLLLLGGCAAIQPPAPPPVEMAAGPAVRPASAPGSLWNSGSAGIFADLKARRIGDILTVAIYEKASASKEATTSTGRDSSASAGLTNLFGLEAEIGKINSAIDPGKLINASYVNGFKGTGATTRKEDLVATLTARVVAVLANGNLKIAGSKTVTVNREDQLIKLTGVVRPADVSAGNIVDSKYVLDARIVYTGKGVISDKQGQGWLVRALDTVWPF
ncbi:MAG: flagellar basal body L-ring protein FlgH [Desulfobacterales bacterium]|nr:flagellar basal body L-ring protein FlgH [Desulfobacterales bacterium]